MPDIPVEPTNAGRYPGDMETRVAILEQTARATAASLERLERTMGASFERIERRLDGFERRLDGFERRLDGFERRLDGFASEQRSDFRWLLGMMLGTAGALLGVMAHGFHWL